MACESPMLEAGGLGEGGAETWLAVCYHITKLYAACDDGPLC